MLLNSLSLRNIPEDEKDQFPWSMPLVKNFDELVFNKPISFFVGENGSGKSTFLEAIAAYAEVPLAGSHRLEDDESLAGSNRLADYLRLRFAERQRRGFFVRAEDFIGFARKIKQDIKDLEKELAEAEAGYVGGDLKLILGPIRGERDALIKRYSADLEAMSHGEGFLKFFTSRITGKGLYLIDEPEAALSPKRQLSLISLIMEKVRKTGSQFIIATHSPIMMSVPDSELFYFDEEKITSKNYRETEHYQLTKTILDNPELVMGEL